MPTRDRPLVVGIGGLHIELRTQRPIEDIGFKAPLDLFLAHASPDLTIELDFAPVPDGVVSGAQLVFDSEGLWQLYETEDRLFILLGTIDERRLYRVATFDRRLSNGHILSDPTGRSGTLGDQLPDPLEYPLAEALMILLMAQHGGLMVHACGLERDGLGYLFVGHSGSGKTTIANLAEKRFRVLNDDRVVLRLVDGRPWMFGTPWHGESTSVSPVGVPVHRAFFIEHADSNGTSTVAPSMASAMLVSRSFPPLWSAESMVLTLSFIDDVTRQVPCRRLGFTPGPGIFDEVARCG
jgi:hypothetical protein